MAKKNRLPVDFAYQKPDNLEITDPLGAEQNAAGKPLEREYPKHLHRFAGLDDKGIMLPLDYVVVADAKEEDALLAEGWGNAINETAEGKKAEAEFLTAAGKKPKPTAVVAAAPAAERKPRGRKKGSKNVAKAKTSAEPVESAAG